MRTPFLGVSITLLIASGCVSGGPAGTSAGGGSRDVITQEELLELPPGTAFEAVERLRSGWLRSRSATFGTSTGRNYPQVFVDNRPYGPLDSLHQFGTESLREIQFIAPADATIRFGTGYPGGIINLLTKGSVGPWPPAEGG